MKTGVVKSLMLQLDGMAVHEPQAHGPNHGKEPAKPQDQPNRQRHEADTDEETHDEWCCFYTT
jgi:hypothetical protein